MPLRHDVDNDNDATMNAQSAPDGLRERFLNPLADIRLAKIRPVTVRSMSVVTGDNIGMAVDIIDGVTCRFVYFFVAVG